MQNLSIQTVMKNRESYNLALPFVETRLWDLTPCFFENLI